MNEWYGGTATRRGEDDGGRGGHGEADPGPPTGEGEGGRAAEQEAVQAGIGAHLQPPRGSPGREQAQAQEGRRRGQPEGDQGRRPQPEPGQGQEHERPQQVEVLLHGERPDVGEDAERASADLGPVAGVEGGEGGRALVALVLHEPEPHDHRPQHHDQGGQEAARPASPEPGQAHRPRLPPFFDEQGGDEEPGQGEEHPHAHGAPADAERLAEVADHDQGDGHTPQAVERGPVAEARTRFGHRDGNPSNRPVPVGGRWGAKRRSPRLTADQPGERCLIVTGLSPVGKPPIPGGSTAEPLASGPVAVPGC